MSTPLRGKDAQSLDLSGLNLMQDDDAVQADEPPPKITIAREKVLEEAKQALQGDSDKRAVNLVVIGHVDAGKSTLMGRLLYELGKMDEKKRVANERASGKIGKSSFSWAWEFDGTSEERERGITMDVASQIMNTPHRQITILDAPGHKDFIPNMISGASQADCALLVVDAATGEFEAGFDRGGQTREHLLLVRSLGVGQVVVAVNKLDQVEWSQARYEEICSLLRPFLVQSGFQPSKTRFVPVGAMAGINLVKREGPEAEPLNVWYKGPTLVDYLDELEPPTRDITAPLRFPISNVFKGQASGTAVVGRVCSGLVQVGERLRVLPGDETAVVRMIDSEGDSLQWAAAGSSVTLYLTSIDPVHLNIGSVLCPPSAVIPLARSFSARIIVFDIQVPITTGASIELFHHSRDVPASITKLIATIDRATGTVIKANPRVLTKSASAEVQITLRTSAYSGPATIVQPIPLEPFSVNKEMGRVLIRRGGETIAAGVVMDILSS
ncbi:EF Tu GTP binding domain-containing protein [Phanerochaete sordida]|uniref:Elongation factor 1 alpha-like protein n=1 Tax=Phanerochaete sordida TaxID=48140 RepID=A0A9P3FZ02_9APHY|nr:EF Tu GTP binding domain-containing protein [Phanerochaete sordida]